MHPLHAELTAHLMTEERLRRAAAERRVRAAAGARPHLRDRLGAGLVRVGTRLQHHTAAPRATSPC